MADVATDIELPEAARAALDVGNHAFALRLTLATVLTGVADELMVLRGLDDTDAGQEAYSVAETLLRGKVRALFACG